MAKLKSLFLAWQDKESRRWFPIGRLTEDDNCYRFQYLAGVHDAQRVSDFQPLPSFPDFEKVYQSEALFPLFANRVMPQSRPDYPNYVTWLQLNPAQYDPLAYLEKSGGAKITDALEIFPAPTRLDNGAYLVHFFVHGVRHMTKESIVRAEQLAKGELLRLSWDAQNPYDDTAITLSTCKEKSGDFSNLGYCPRYLSETVEAALKQDRFSCKTTVEQVNSAPAPTQFRVLCRLELTTPNGEAPFSGPEFQPMEALPIGNTVS